MYNAKHREFSTGFYYGRADADKTTRGESSSPYEMVATIGKKFDKDFAETIMIQGKNIVKDFFDKIDAMHEEAKKAKHIELENHPERCPLPLETKNDFLLYEYHALNKVNCGTTLEYVGPEIIGIKDDSYVFVDTETLLVTFVASPNHDYYLYTDKPIGENFIVRQKVD